MRQRVTAWGSDQYPDLDYETTDPVDMSLLTSRYPMIQVALLTAIPQSTLDDALLTGDSKMPHPYKDPNAQREAAPQVAEAGATLSKMMLTDIHAKVKAAFPKVVKNIWRVAKVHSMASLGEYQVTIKVPDYQPFHWEGHAVNEYHARLAAWHEFLLRQQTPGLMPVHRMEGV